jgi:hypothetical protein
LISQALANRCNDLAIPQPLAFDDIGCLRGFTEHQAVFRQASPFQGNRFPQRRLIFEQR